MKDAGIQHYFKNATLKKILGLILVLIGIIGIVTPLLPGLALIWIGLELLGWRIIFSERIRRWMK